MQNPIPKHTLWVTPTLDQVAEIIESMPKKEKAQAYNIMMMTLNACHALVEEAQKETV